MNDNPFGERTLYTLVDLEGNGSTITLDKLPADVLQTVLPDVHAWVQNAYTRVATRRPQATRREQGNFVRALAYREAQKHPEYERLLSEFL